MKIVKNICAMLLCLVIIAGIVLLILKTVIYPTKFMDIIEKSSKENQVDKYLILSIIKKESRFNVNAISKKDAKGLMQILDSTANEFSENKKYDLFNKNDNIQIGTKYLKYLLDRYENNIVLTLCAYNAGLGNVDNWLQNKTIYSEEKIDISKIPFNETKEYVKDILLYYSRYKELYD